MTDVQPSAAASRQRIACAEIWGGVTVVDTEVCTRGLSAAIYSRASGSAVGGDIYYVSVCGSDLLTRLLVADVRGHGLTASELSQWLYEAVLARMNSLDGAGILSEMNGVAHGKGFEAITTAVIASYYVSDRRLYFSYAGHPPMLVARKGQGWQALDLPQTAGVANLPLGIAREVRYDQESVGLESGDRFLLFSDGLAECANGEGELFADARLAQVLESHRTAPLDVIKDQLRSELEQFAGGPLDHDDCTFIVAEVN